MTDRDQRMQALQVENAELKNLLTSFLERTNAGGSAQSPGGAQAGDRLHGPGGNESSRLLGVACGFLERGRETSHDPPFGNEQRVRVPGRDPPGLPAQSQADLRLPPGLPVDPRVDLRWTTCTIPGGSTATSWRLSSMSRGSSRVSA